jgi:hypothetical protein
MDALTFSMRKRLQMHHLSLDHHRLTSFPVSSRFRNVTSISFANNPLSSFAGLPTIPTLQHLDLSRTNIRSFEAANRQPNLISISLSGTHLATWPHLTEMCLIALSDRLEIVCGKYITDKQRSYADRTFSALSPLLFKGWVLMAADPIRILHEKTRARRLVFVAQPKDKPASAVPSGPDRPAPAAKPRRCRSRLDQERTIDELESDANLKLLIHFTTQWNPRSIEDGKQKPPPRAKSALATRVRSVTRTKGGPNDWRAEEQRNRLLHRQARTQRQNAVDQQAVAPEAET